MKTAVWYTSTFVVIFVYLYVYLVQFIRGAEIRPPLLRHHQPLRSRLGGPLAHNLPPVPPNHQFPPTGVPSLPPVGPTLAWPPGVGHGGVAPSAFLPPSQRQLPPPPATVFQDYLNNPMPGNMAAASSLSSAPVQPPAPKPLDFSYHNYEDMTAWLKHFSASNPDLTALYSIGKSVQGE